MFADRFRLSGIRPPLTLLTDRAVARWLQVSRRMVRLWVATAAWPLPRYTRGSSWLFDRSEVEWWLRTGSWPTGVHFRTAMRPNRERPRVERSRPLRFSSNHTHHVRRRAEPAVMKPAFTIGAP
jgi:hypothetical protein